MCPAYSRMLLVQQEQMCCTSTALLCCLCNRAAATAAALHRIGSHPANRCKLHAVQEEHTHWQKACNCFTPSNFCTAYYSTHHTHPPVLYMHIHSHTYDTDFWPGSTVAPHIRHTCVHCWRGWNGTAHTGAAAQLRSNTRHMSPVFEKSYALLLLDFT